MKTLRFLGPILMAALPLAANTMNITNATSAVLNTGDTLSFTFSTYGPSAAPSNVSFNLVADALASGALFQATLTSRDGSITTEFAQPSTFRPSQFQGAYYHGAAASLYGSLTLSNDLSSALFAGSSAILELQNLGPAITLSFAPYTLAQDLSVSLYGNGVARGGVPVQVRLETSSDDSADNYPSHLGLNSSAAVPEPASLLFVLLAVLFASAAHLFRRRIAHFNSNVCKPVWVSDTIVMADRNPSFEVPQIQPTE
jgi:hypothetical protein